MKMKTTLSLVAAAAVALFSYGAMAQEKSRAEVKEEAKGQAKTGTAGEAGTARHPEAQVDQSPLRRQVRKQGCDQGRDPRGRTVHQDREARVDQGSL